MTYLKRQNRLREQTARIAEARALVRAPPKLTAAN